MRHLGDAAANQPSQAGRGGQMLWRLLWEIPGEMLLKWERIFCCFCLQTCLHCIIEEY